MADTSKTPADLIAASEPLGYEIDMLFGTAEGLTSRLFGPGVIQNALIESFAMHARALLAFLYPEKKMRKEGDITANDYITDWPGKRPAEADILKPVHHRTNKEIAHLTRARVGLTDEAKGWKPDEITTEIGKVLD